MKTDKLRLASTVLLTAAATAVAAHPSQEPDVFFHVQLGRAVLRHLSRVVPETQAFSDFEPTCMVPAWLWDVIAYAAHAAGGFSLLSLLNLVFAALCAFLITRWTRASAPEASSLAWVSVSTIMLICVSTRFALRPQTLAFAVLTGFLLLLHGYVSLPARQQRARGVYLVLLALVWAQLHGSFVLAPVLFAIGTVGAWLEGHRGLVLAGRRTLLLVQCALLLTLFTSAAGVSIASYITEHGYGDAVKLIAEMAPPTWTQLVSLNGAYGKALVLLWLLSLVGLTEQARFRWTAIGFALLGHVLLSRAQRFVAEDAILCAPLAMSGAVNVGTWARAAMGERARNVAAALCVLASTALWGQQLEDSLRGYGGRFGIGIDETAFPALAAAYLQRMPQGTRVLSAFTAGPALGLWSQGKLRTYVDGRTPMYFDDADYAVARDAFGDADALDRALRRYAPRAAVVERAHGVCDLFARRWRAVVIEARYTTFVPPDGDEAPLRAIDPCGPEFVHRTKVQPAELDDSLARLSALHPSKFIDMLRAERMLLDPKQDAARSLRLLDASGSTIYGAYHRRLRIAALARAGRIDDAYGLMHAALEEGDVSVLALMGAPELGTLDLARARALIELGIAQLGEATPPVTRSMLAAICVQQDDAACARYNALRAAVRGAPNVMPSLAWLTEHAGSARMRADAAAWLALLKREQAVPPASPVAGAQGGR